MAGVAPTGSQRGIGLALSGGGARGIAHVGVLGTLAEEGIPVCAIAGTSAGAIVGALFAAGVPLESIERIALETRWSDLLALALPHGGMVSGEGLERFLEGLLPAESFSDCRLPFAAVAADLRTGERVDLVSGSLARAVRASCSIPVIFEPTPMAGRLLVDGGLASQIPVRAARETLNARPVVAVDVNAHGMAQGKLTTTAQVAIHLGMLWTAHTARDDVPLADHLIAVNVRGIPLYDLGQGQELLQRGRAAARAEVPEIRALLNRSA
jgi:NTE family protein